MTAADTLTLDEAAARLGVHYMTAYRYVRTGRLAAEKTGAAWRVRTRDVDALRAAPHRAEPAPRRTARRTLDPTRFEHRLLAGDEAGAWTIAQQALAAGADPDEIYLGLLAPALTSIGERWASGEITIGDEHRASVVAARLVGRLGPLFTRRGRTRGTIVVGAVAGDHHALPSALFADLLRRRGFGVVDLGADTPAMSFAEATAAADRLVGVGICATTTGNDAAIAATVAAVKRGGDVPVVLGGRAVGGATDAARLGADRHSTDAADALAQFERLGETAAATRRAAGSRR